ncbi:hypothetical protein [Demequina globuliformis]|uniref:hypothetical protein n=1 Tax=Demequina globuliformis TaxID=676202 RepID=UPI0007806565|nr:hypothetical protein [Demequina globuliformis]
MTRLTDEDVVRLRERYAGGERQSALAEAFGISQTSVSALVAGRARAHAGGPLAAPRGRAPRPDRAPSSPRRAALTPAVAAEVKSRVGDGQARASVAADLGISLASVHSIMAGRRGGSTGARAGALDDETRARIRAAYLAGQSQSAIARAEGTSQQMVSKVVRDLR